jgi:AraC-like DNA-binding protein
MESRRQRAGVPEPVLDAAVGRPAPTLRRHLDRYLGYRYAGFPPGIHRGLPSRSLTVILSLGRPVEIAAMPDPAQAPGSYQAFVGGLHAAPATVAHDGDQYGISLELRPFAARTLFGVPAGALAGSVVDLTDLLGPRATRLTERLAAAPGWRARFAVLDDELTGAAADGPDPPAEVAWAWRRLLGSGGAAEVGALAAEVGWSRRHLAQRFRAELGLPPKLLGRVLRFERACRLLRRDRRPGLAEVAASCGYYDQAHLTRDWREFAGCPPTAWLAQELPSVQDEPELGAAG